MSPTEPRSATRRQSRPGFHPNDWTPAQVALLYAHYPATPVHDILKLLAPRTWIGIQVKANKLQILRTGRARNFPWTPGELDTLRTAYPTLGPLATAALLSRHSRQAIRQRAHHLGLLAAHVPPAPKPAPAPRPPKPVKEKVVKLVKVKPPKVAKVKPVKEAKVKLPKPAKQVLAAPVPKALPVAGAASAGSLATPRLNARKDQRQREERARAKDFSITAALKAEAPDSEGRRIYTVAARQGGQAGIAAFLSWKQQQAA